MISDNNPDYAENLRFAIGVMDESSHLGLDAEYASKLRSLMLEQIAKAEKAQAHIPAVHNEEAVTV